MNSPSRRAKIVATLGPASSDETTIENLIKAGVNVFRFNFSHGSHEDHSKRFTVVRAAAKKLNRPIAILQDLQGPKLRVGMFANNSLEIIKGEEVILKLETRESIAASDGKKKIIPYNYELLAKEIRVGHRIMMDDGNMEIVVTKIDDQDIYAQVIFGGVLKNHKGMNFPDTKISIESFTPKDREDLLLGMKLGVDYIALSFVRTAEDVRSVKRFMHAHKKNIPVVSKIEKGEAIANFHEILDVTDAVMVARGDLAVEVGTAQVPILQKMIIRESRKRGTPVITATQMLESMINTPRPTRAEASDVANAVLDGTDALMLSAESASGKFPVLAVSVMHNIILETELRTGPGSGYTSEFHDKLDPKRTPTEAPSLVEAIEHAASNLATWLNAKAVACTTNSGHAARALARYRPNVPIFAVTDSQSVLQQLALVWGVHTTLIKRNEDIDMLAKYAENALIAAKIVDKGDLFVFTAGWPPLKHGTTSVLRVVTVSKSQEVTKKAKTSDQSAIHGYRTKNAQFVLDQSLCIQCGGCVEVCPNDIFGIHERRVFLKESNCNLCTFDDACMEICPTSAIEIIRLDD